MNDTPPDVEARYRAMLMSLAPEERFMRAVRSFDAARALVLASLPPKLTPEEKRRLLFRRFYGDIPDSQVPPELRSW